MNRLNRIILGLGLVSLAACAGMPTPLPDSDSPGARLYDAKCGPCHSTPHPGRHTYSQWEGVVSRMEKEMEYKKLEPLTEDQRSTILTYLKEHSR